MDTLTADEAEHQLPKMVEDAVKLRRHFRITSGECSAILLPEETYDNLLVTLELLSTPGLMDSLRQANPTILLEENHKNIDLFLN